MELEEALRTLDLRPGASVAEVRKAYRRSLKLWHPDRFVGDAARALEADQQTRKIIQAYRTLAGSTHAQSTSGDRGGPEWFEMPLRVQLNPFRRAGRPPAPYPYTTWDRVGITLSLLGMLAFTVLAIVFDW